MTPAELKLHTLALCHTLLPTARCCVYEVGTDQEPHGHVVQGGDTRWIESYIREYRRIDPFHPRHFVGADRNVFRTEEGGGDLRQVDRYNAGFRWPMGVVYKAEVFVRDEQRQIVAGLRVSRSKTLGEFDSNDITALEVMQPVLQAAWRSASGDDPLARVRDQLSQREQQVLALVLTGMPNKLICRELGLALPTVKCHVTNTMRKLGVATRTELVTRLYGRSRLQS